MNLEIMQKLKKVLLIENYSWVFPYDQSESIASKYMNRFAIDEDDQFEIAAFQTNEFHPPFQIDAFGNFDSLLGETLDEALKAVENLTKQQNKALNNLFSRDVSNQLHIIMAIQYSDSLQILLMNVKRVLKRFGCKSAMLSIITMWKNNCITKEELVIEYGITDGVEEQNIANQEERYDLSVGDDLETLIKRIKNANVSNEQKGSFLFCLLNSEELKKLERKDQHFLDTFECKKVAEDHEEKTKESEYKHVIFSKSWADRVTFFTDTEPEEKE